MELTFNPNASKAAIEAAKKLIERYNEITVEDVFKWWPYKFDSVSIARSITGYGSTRYCTLCNVCSVNKYGIISLNCGACIFLSSHISVHCNRDCNEKTYDNIGIAETPEELVTAFKNRAAHITKIVELIEKHQQLCN